MRYCVAFLFLVTFLSATPAKEWRGIIPLQSTQKDVIRLLGNNTNQAWAYELENERVFFDYQYPGKACGEKSGDWEVPYGTVLGITVYPKKHLLLVFYETDQTKFKRLDSCSPNGFAFYNAEEGISYSTDDGLVGQIHFGPTSKDHYLKCPDPFSRTPPFSGLITRR